MSVDSLYSVAEEKKRVLKNSDLSYILAALLPLAESLIGIGSSLELVFVFISPANYNRSFYYSS